MPDERRLSADCCGYTIVQQAGHDQNAFRYYEAVPQIAGSAITPSGLSNYDLLAATHGSSVSFSNAGDPDEQTENESQTQNGSHNALQIWRSNYTTSGRESSVATPSAKSSTTAVASTASSVTMPNPSDWEYVQRHKKAIDGGRMDQIQLFANFLETHFASPEAKADLINRGSYLMALPDIDLSSAPMLRNAVEAVCYAHVGATRQDQRLVQASRRAYGRVLNALVRSLNNPGKPTDPQVIVPSIMLLTLFDDSLPESKSTDWRAHYWGVHEYLRATGPSAFPMMEPFSRMLFLNLRIPTMFLGIAKRKAIVLSEPKWRALGHTSGFGSTPLGRLYPRALQLPGLLEKTDTCLRKNTHADAKLIMKDLMTIRGELVTWSTTESSFADKTIKHFTHVDASSDDIFDFDIEEHLVMSANTTFESYFDFSSFKVAQDYALYWIFALIVDCALLRVMHFRPDTEKCIRPRTRAETERDAANRAKYLCRGAYFFAKFDSQGITSFLETQVALAESFFSETSAVKELGWCQSVRVANQVRLMRLREKQPKTLCRMGDMVGDLATATRFKSRRLASNTGDCFGFSVALRFVEDVPAEETGQPPEADLGQSNAMVKSQNGRLPPSTWDLAEIGSPGSFGAVVLRRFGFYMQTNPTFLPASLGKE